MESKEDRVLLRSSGPSRIRYIDTRLASNSRKPLPLPLNCSAGMKRRHHTWPLVDFQSICTPRSSLGRHCSEFKISIFAWTTLGDVREAIKQPQPPNCLLNPCVLVSQVPRNRWCVHRPTIIPLNNSSEFDLTIMKDALIKNICCCFQLNIIPLNFD